MFKGFKTKMIHFNGSKYTIFQKVQIWYQNYVFYAILLCAALLTRLKSIERDNSVTRYGHGHSMDPIYF